jgi:hypothetical protein
MTVVVCLCVFSSGAAQNNCPGGFSIGLGATAGIFATENTAVAVRARCTSTNYTNRQVYEHIGTAACETAGDVLCIARSSRCTNAGNDVQVLGSNVYCLSCDAGSIKSGQICTNCAAGQYRQAHTADVCQSCQVGKSSQEGSTSALDCDDDNCQFCARGTYSANEGSSTCESCTDAAVTFDTTAGQPQCTACPTDTSSVRHAQHVCTMQQFDIQTAPGAAATTAAIYSGHNNSVWFHIDNNYTSLRHILDSMRHDWNPGAQLFIASAIGQPQPLNPTVLQCTRTAVLGNWSPMNVNPVHNSNEIRYVLLSAD